MCKKLNSHCSIQIKAYSLLSKLFILEIMEPEMFVETLGICLLSVVVQHSVPLVFIKSISDFSVFYFTLVGKASGNAKSTT